MNGLLAGLAAASIWGAMFVVTKLVLPVVGPFTLLTFRLLLGGLALAALWVWKNRGPQLTKPGLGCLGDWTPLLWAGFLGFGISLSFQFIGTDLSTAGEGALITCATPVFVALFASPLLGERLGRAQWSALALATSGVLFVLAPSLSLTANQLPWGVLCLVAAALTWALFSVLTARAGRGKNLILASLVGFLGGLPVSLAGTLWEVYHRPLGIVDGPILAGILFLGLVSTALAMLLWNYAFQVLPASTAGLTFFAQPVVGTLLGALVLGEAPGAPFYAGAALIGAALFLGRKK